MNASSAYATYLTQCMRAVCAVFWLVATALAMPTQALAQTTEVRTLARATELRAENYSDATVLSNLLAGVKVELVRTLGVWAQVRYGAVTGWVRFSALDSSGAKPSGFNNADTGRMASGNIIATSGIRSLRSNRHALIFGVGEYEDPRIAALSGVTHDIDSAKKIAYDMGIPDSNITVLRDKQATLAGMKQALLDLDERVRDGDRVFVYYSGHGTRWFDGNINSNDCTEALLPSDAKPLTNQAIAALLKPISDKADKLIVLYDACHSGGIVGEPLKTRSIMNAGLTLTPKMAALLAPEQCSVPSNLKTRSLANESVKLGGLASNIVHISSSRSDEVSFDEPGKGGLATQYFRDCMGGQAKDLDGSGSLNIAEIMACAQAKLDTALAGRTDLRAPHMTVGGNAGFVPSLFKQEAPTPLVLALATPAGTTNPEPEDDEVETQAVPAPTLAPVTASTPAPSSDMSPTPPPPASTAVVAPVIAPAPVAVAMVTPMPNVAPAPLAVVAPAAPPAVTPAPIAAPAPAAPPASAPSAQAIAAIAPTLTPAPIVAPAPAVLPVAAPALQTIAAIAPTPTPVIAPADKPLVSKPPASAASHTIAAVAAPAAAKPPVQKPVPLAPAIPARKTDPAVAFDDAVAQADGKIVVTVKPNKTTFKIAKDELLLDVTSSADGYVNIIMLGSDRKTYYMLFPNALDQDNAIQAGQTLRLPRKSWGIVPQGPAGTDDVLVVVTESPRDLAAIGGAKVGPFLANLTNANGRANLQWLLGTSQSFDTADCSQGGKTRNFGTVKKCSDRFGAVRVTLKEVK